MANGNFGGGNGTVGNPYLVEDAADLDAIRNDVFSHYKQTAHIDLNTWGEWNPISDESDYFGGSFDGNEKKILNIVIAEVESYYYSAMFADCENAVFKNISFVNAFSTGGEGSDISILLGYGNGVTIENCSVDGRVISDGMGSLLVAELGDGYENKIINCQVSGSVSASYGGLLVAECLGASFLKCSAEGELKVRRADGGGLVGSCWTSNFRECRADVVIRTSNNDSYRVGGLVGDGYGLHLKDCYSSGEFIYSENNTRYGDVGGIVGAYSYDGCIIENCYSEMSVSGYYNVGGLLGRTDEYAVALIKNSFALNKELRVFGDKGFYENTGYISGYSEAMLQNSFYLDTFSSYLISNPNGTPISKNDATKKQTYIDAGWDFKNIWTIREGESYPYFIPPPTKSKTKCERIAINKLLGGY